jgi:sulfate transport system ATP-binding protein
MEDRPAAPGRREPAATGGVAVKIEVRHLTKRFGAFTALDGVSLDAAEGELLALLGPSGCGKTTLLRILSGLEYADSGTIRFGGEDITRQKVSDRRVGFVFQHYALFRHMSVFENVAFGLRIRREGRPSKAEIRRRVEALLSLVKVEGMGDRYPAQLSGGQRQRVALARALAVEPKVLLLDEPFGALDAKVRKELRRWLRRLHDELHVTSIFVTHDVEEALEVSDRVLVMHEGRVQQIGKPDDVYEHPATPFVYRFLGSVNLFHARIQHGRVDITASDDPSEDAPRVVAYARPHEVEITTERGTQPALEAQIVRLQAVGPVVRIELRRCDNDEVVEAELSRERSRDMACRPGDRVFVRPSRVRVFDSP